MSAPVTERGRAATRTATIPAQRGGTGAKGYGWPSPPAKQKGRQRSARKAYERRDDRLRRLVGGRATRTSASTGRAQFVLLIMALLAIGLVATLWFSTAAAADSYRLQDARAEALALSQQAERLHREVAVLESAPELARRAAQLGMVPVQDPARLVVAPDGGVTVVGEPRAAAGPPPPSDPAAPPPAPGANPEQPQGAPEGAVQPAPPADAGQPTGPGAAAELAAGQQGDQSGDQQADGAVAAQGASEQDGTDAQNVDGATAPPAGQGDQGGPPTARTGDTADGAAAPQGTGEG